MKRSMETPSAINPMSNEFAPFNPEAPEPTDRRVDLGMAHTAIKAFMDTVVPFGIDLMTDAGPKAGGIDAAGATVHSTCLVNSHGRLVRMTDDS